MKKYIKSSKSSICVDVLLPSATMTERKLFMCVKREKQKA